MKIIGEKIKEKNTMNDEGGEKKGDLCTHAHMVFNMAPTSPHSSLHVTDFSGASGADIWFLPSTMELMRSDGNEAQIQIRFVTKQER